MELFLDAVSVSASHKRRWQELDVHEGDKDDDDDW
jgi:hypothetical protein